MDQADTEIRDGGSGGDEVKAAVPLAQEYERCEHCSAPVEERQRYCVACGSRRRSAEDPVARFLAQATSRSRTTAARPTVRAGGRARGLGTAAVIAAIPLAVALGVIVGRANSGGDAKLLAALRAQKAPVVTVAETGTSASAEPAAVTAPAVTSTFSLHSGYAVEVATLSAQGTGQAAVAKAEQTARAKGATGLGVIALTNFTVNPRPPGAGYVVYSGQYSSRTAASTALAKLRRRFPGATVIDVRERASSHASSSASAGSGGTVHVTASKSQIAQSEKVAQGNSHNTGSGYVKAENAAPGSTSLP